MATEWTIYDRLRVASGKDRRAKLLLSLDGGGSGGTAPSLATHNLRLFVWNAKAPGAQSRGGVAAN